LGAIRRDAFARAGGFDERYTGATMEDIELGMRISSAGGRIVLDPLLRGTHLKRWPVWSMVRTDLWGRGTPWVRLLFRRRELPTALNLGWRHRLSALLSVYLAWALARRRGVRATATLAGFLGLNHRFHLLLWRRGRRRTAVLGLPLHVVHHLTAVAAVASGCALELGSLLRRLALTRLPLAGSVDSGGDPPDLGARLHVCDDDRTHRDDGALPDGHVARKPRAADRARLAGSDPVAWAARARAPSPTSSNSFWGPAPQPKTAETGVPSAVRAPTAAMSPEAHPRASTTSAPSTKRHRSRVMAWIERSGIRHDHPSPCRAGTGRAG
ncbi:MAG: hypothetical protein WKF96_22100, partial [Solirubrobacteraceae bacterium]